MKVAMKSRNKMKMQSSEKKILRPDEVAALYSLNVGSLGNLRNHDRGPKYFKRDRKIFYKPEDVEKWLFENPILTEDSTKDCSVMKPLDKYYETNPTCTITSPQAIPTSENGCY